MSPHKTIAVFGRKENTKRYEACLTELGISHITTLSLSRLSACHALLLPGGGDITPSLFGQQNQGSRNIDTPLDLLQLQALKHAVSEKKPVLGICKGMQLINVFFGGTLVQHMQCADRHRYISPEENAVQSGDRYHDTNILPTSFLYLLYGERLFVNSAHHQCIDKPGKDLLCVQYSEDGIPEALCHKTLPVFGVQWHPERLMPEGKKLLSYFAAL